MVPTCFAHSCGHPQGVALQRMAVSRYDKFFKQMHRCKRQSFKDVWFKMRNIKVFYCILKHILLKLSEWVYNHL